MLGLERVGQDNFRIEAMTEICVERHLVGEHGGIWQIEVSCKRLGIGRPHRERNQRSDIAEDRIQNFWFELAEVLILNDDLQFVLTNLRQHLRQRERRERLELGDIKRGGFAFLGWDLRALHDGAADLRNQKATHDARGDAPDGALGQVHDHDVVVIQRGFEIERRASPRDRCKAVRGCGELPDAGEDRAGRFPLIRIRIARMLGQPEIAGARIFEGLEQVLPPALGLHLAVVCRRVFLC